KKEQNSFSNNLKEFVRNFEDHSSVILVIDILTGEIKEVNKEASNFYGWSVDELIKMNISHISNNSNQEIFSNIEEIINNGSNVFRTFHKLANGKVKEVDEYASIITFDNRKYLFSIVYDISEKIRIKNELKRTEILFKTIADFTNSWEIFRDKDGKLVYCSPEFERITGHSVDDYINGKITLRDFVHVDDRDKLIDQLSEILRTREALKDIQFRIKDKDNNILYLIARTQPVYIDGEFNGTRISVKDNTEIRNKLEAQSEILREISKIKDRFFSIVAHDLKNPFTVLLSYVNLMIEQIDRKDKEDIKEDLKIIEKSAKKTYALLENLLLWSNAQSKGFGFKPENIKLETIIKDSVSLLEENARKKEIKIMLEIDHGFEIYADRNMIYTILRNLISNAIKYTYERGEINISAKDSKNKQIISISDTGIGIEKENVEKLFDIGVKFQKEGTNDEIGTGLGLKICKEFVKKHRGDILVESSPGVGSRFKVVLPKL
ncbi:MAG: ATP-binding protein, partial [Bacteroidota bacterium]|nr:ATP-binding protein [Bacteroidota bacterium]